MKVLIVSPHMDDEVLGCGGTIAKHVNKGDEVFVCFVANRVYNHKFDKQKNEIEKKHALKAKKVLNYKEAVFLGLHDERLDVSIQDIIIPIEKYFLKIKPDYIYCPFYGDNNQDHRAVFDAVRVIIRPTASHFLKKVFLYEVPTSTEQSPPIIDNIFAPNYYVDIKKYFSKKIEAFKCYETEARKYPNPRSLKALEVLAQKRATEIGFEYAEAFVILRDKWG